MEEMETQQQELSELFARSMNFMNPAPVPTPPPQEQKQEEQQQHHHHQPVTYASAHYTHSSHIPRTSSSSSPTPLEEVQLIEILQQNSIDPRLLFPNQITLFQLADNDQRLRLLELWRIAPPTCTADGLARHLGTWPETSLQREEELARIRYERTGQQHQQQQQQLDDLDRHPQQHNGQQGLWQPHQHQPMEEMMSDISADEPSLPSSAPATYPSSPVIDQRNAEPYILSGYEQLAKRDYDRPTPPTAFFGGESTRYNSATDPAYGWGGKHGDAREGMENSYGAFAQMREFGGMGGGGGAGGAGMDGGQKTHFVGFDPMDGDCVM